MTYYAAIKATLLKCGKTGYKRAQSMRYFLEVPTHTRLHMLHILFFNQQILSGTLS